MLKRRIIPCLDIKDGRVVKGVHFGGLRDTGDPLEAARLYDFQGADEICMLDVTGTQEGRDRFVDVVRRVSEQLLVPLTVGGGIRRESDVRALLNAGADKVAVNSAALRNPKLFSECATRYGSQCLVAAIDVRRVRGGRGLDGRTDFEVMIEGGSQASGVDALWWCREVERLGAGEILLTGMDRFGTRTGYDLELTQLVARSVGIPVIAAGGVGDLQHLADGLAPDRGEADAVLAGAIFHFGLYSIGQAKSYIAEQGLPVRRPDERRVAAGIAAQA